MLIAPIGVRPPYSVTVLSGFEISASWYPPKSSAGLLTHYILRAYNMDRPELAPVETIFTDMSIYNGETSGDSILFQNCHHCKPSFICNLPVMK